MNFLETYWLNIVQLIGTVFAYFGGRKMTTISEKKADADALTSMQKGYNEFVIDQKERYAELKEELKYVRDELKTVKEEGKFLREEVRDWKEKYNKLKKEFDLYKAKHK